MVCLKIDPIKKSAGQQQASKRPYETRDRWFSVGMVSHAKGHRAMSGDIFGCHHLEEVIIRVGRVQGWY